MESFSHFLKDKGLIKLCALVQLNKNKAYQGFTSVYVSFVQVYLINTN